jgi:hypothetical protein
METALLALAEGTELAVRVKPGNLGIRPEHVPDRFDFFFDPLLHDQLSTNAAHEKRQVWLPVAKRRRWSS